MKELGQSVVLLILMIFGILFNALVFQNLFEWFIADTFNIATISYLQSFGLLLLVSFFRSKKIPEDREPFEVEVKNTGFLIFNSAFALALGFIIKGFI